MTLNRNVSDKSYLKSYGEIANFRQLENVEIDQVAFSPGHLVSGVEASADPVLQARIFSYPDTQMHRPDVNYQQIPVNQPLHHSNPYQRDGFMAVGIRAPSQRTRQRLNHSR